MCNFVGNCLSVFGACDFLWLYLRNERGAEFMGTLVSVENLSDDDIQEMYLLAHFLHPYSPETALRIAKDAVADRLPSFGKATEATRTAGTGAGGVISSGGNHGLTSSRLHAMFSCK